MCQEDVWKVSGVRNEKSKPAAGRPLVGVLHWVLQGEAWRVAGGHVGLAGRSWAMGMCGSRHTQLSGSCLEVVWEVSGVRQRILVDG